MTTRKATKKSAKKASAKTAATKKTATKKSPTKKAAKRSAKKSTRSSSTPPSRRWSAKVTSDSTHPSSGLFKKSAEAIAEEMLKSSVSPRGPGQAMQMLSFYENRAGKDLPAERKRAIEKAKDIVRGHEAKPAKSAKKSTRR
jgi:hypothetical protein